MNTPTMRAVQSQKNAKILKKRLCILFDLLLPNTGIRLRQVHVTGIANSLDPLAPIRQIAQLLAQFADVNVNTAIEWTQFAPQNGRGNIVATHDASSRAQQHLQQIEFYRGYIQHLSVQGNAARSRIELDIAHVHRMLGSIRAACIPSPNGADAGQ